jgi:hypothetical protein
VENGVENGRRQYQAYCEDAEESETEQTGGNFLPVDSLEDSALADTGGGPENSVAQQNRRPSRQAAQAAVTLISQQLEIAQYRPCKRKHGPKGPEASNCDHTEAMDATDAELESLEASGYCDPCLHLVVMTTRMTKSCTHPTSLCYRPSAMVTLRFWMKA